MSSTSQTPEGRDGALPTLNGFIEVVKRAKDACGIPPAQTAFGSASALLTIIRDTNEQEFVELGRSCVDVCEVLDRGLDGKRLDELSQPVLKAIGHFAATMATIQGKIVEEGRRGAISKFIRPKADKVKIAAWKQDLLGILQIFSTELVINAVVMISDLHRDREAVPHSDQPGQPSISLGESPPPALKSCFGRDELVEKVVRLAENFEPIALIGAGGIGKTSVALSVLHHNRIKARFGDNRRFIRCDQFPASLTHFLARLSKVIGAGVENPEDLTPLRPFLSSKQMLVVLDNVESILDPQVTNGRELYHLVNEMCQFETICVCITSRITTVPQHCARPVIPTLSMEAARDIFYRIYGDHSGRSDAVDDLLRGLDFHALSITLLATTASHNAWSHDRLAEEWRTSRAQMLRTDYNESLAATMELSLNSPTFRKLGPTARDLLAVVAFFPQGVAEKNLDWLFPAITGRKNIFDKFCALSLTHRNNGFITMLAPIRDYLRPQHPMSSPLLCATKDHYFTRLSVELYPGRPGFEEAQWIISENVNVEHLLDVFISTDTASADAWDTCGRFLDHLYWHKPRETVLAQRIETLPDENPSKPGCLLYLSKLFDSVGKQAKRKELLTQALELQRRRGDDAGVARVLSRLCDANRRLELFEEGIRQAEEAVEIYQRLGDTVGQADCWYGLAFLRFGAGQLDAAEEAASRATELIPEKGEEFIACQSNRVLGHVHLGKGERKKAFRHYQTALETASLLHWHNEVFWNHFNLARLFDKEDDFSKANAHIRQAKSYTINNSYLLGRATEMQARIWGRQRRFKEAISEASRAIEIFEGLGAVVNVKCCRDLLQELEGQ